MSHPAHSMSRVALALVVVLSVAVLSTPAAAAQDDVSVTVSPESTSVESGETTTYEIVVQDVDGGGVGALDITVAVNSSVANITDAEFEQNPGIDEIEHQDNHSRVRFSAALMDTEQSGSVTVATVTVEGTKNGSSPISVDVHDVGSEEGMSYKISSVQNGTLTVGTESDTSADEETTDDDDTGAETGSDDEDSSQGTASESDSTLTVSETNTDLVGQLDVQSHAVTPDDPRTGDEVTFEAVLENTGSSDVTVQAQVVQDGTVLVTKDVSVAAGSTTKVELATTVSTADPARFTAGPLLVTQQNVTTAAAETRSTTAVETTHEPTETTSVGHGTTTSTTSVPGFTVLSVVVAVFLSGMVFSTRRQD